jgi:MerR family transcriptional regulator, light-induced transcriptional regulator
LPVLESSSASPALPDAEGQLAPPATARLRSGTAARLAGVPVSTLRVWERRYGVVAAPKTPTGQRLYTAHDVQRLRLLRLLTDRGHGIGTMATLDLAALQRMAEVAPPPLSAVAEQHVWAVGRSAAQKLAAAAGGARLTVFEDRGATDATVHSTRAAAPPDVLLLHLPSVQPRNAERALALARRVRAQGTVLLYAFGSQMLLDSLAAAGLTLRREPVSGRDLARLVAGMARPESTAALPGNAAVAPRRFSEDSLVALAESPSSVACECPRHLAEIVMQLGCFERYSADCLSRSPADAALHRHLSALAGTARSMFEQALERVMVQEGVPLPPAPSGG